MTDTSAKAQSQKAAILAHLTQHGYIDSRTSRELYGCEALRSRIADLRKAGHEIETKMIAFKSKYGHPGRYGVYVMKGFEKKIVEQKLLKNSHFKTHIMVQPKHIRTVDWYADSVFKNTESEIILRNLVVMQKNTNPEQWTPFTWEQYAEFRNSTSEYKCTESERGVLDTFVMGGRPVWNTSAHLSSGWLDFDIETGQYSFTAKMIEMLARDWSEKTDEKNIVEKSALFQE